MMKSSLSFLSEPLKNCLIVGLGNPGLFYEKTRHNVGVRAVSHFAEKRCISLEGKKLHGSVRWGCEVIAGNRVHLVLPQTYHMNQSGQMIKAVLNTLDMNMRKMVVIVDDVALPFGKIRLREKGSHGGHNGLRNIEEQLHSSHYSRLRIGISVPEGDLASYVLQPFPLEEEALLPQIFDRVSTALECWIEKGIVAAIQQANTPPSKPSI